MNDTPADLEAALKTAGLADFFAGCTPAHRREYVRWIGEAKREETRKARIGKAITMIADKCAEEKAGTKTKHRR